MIEIIEHLDKNNLHHAYLIEGIREEIEPEILKFIESLGIKTFSNPDFYYISVNSFKIEDAHNLKSIEHEKGFLNGKKIFLIYANNFLLEAQNTLLKIFEEPIENTHFFVITPNTNILLKTLISRFYLIKTKPVLEQELKNAEKFILMSLKDKIDFIRELIKEVEENEENIIEISNTRLKTLKFLNALEIVVSKKIFNKDISKTPIDNIFFQHLFKIREFINQPGSSIKILMESLALIVPNV